MIFQGTKNTQPYHSLSEMIALNIFVTYFFIILNFNEEIIKIIN